MTMAKVDQEVPEATPQELALLKCEKCGRAARVWLDSCEFCKHPQKLWYEDRRQQLEKKLASEERVHRDYVDKLNHYANGERSMQETITHLERKLRDKSHYADCADRQVETLNDVVGEKTARIVSLKGQVDHQARAILVLESRTKHNDGYDSTEDGRLRGLLTRVVAAVDVSGFADAVKHLEANIHEWRRAVEIVISRKTQIDEKDVEIVRLRDAVIMQQKDIDNQQERLEAKQERIEEQKVTLCEVAERNAYLEAQADKVAVLANDVDGLHAKLASKSTYICLMAKQKAALEYKLKDFANLRAENCHLNDGRHSADKKIHEQYAELVDLRILRDRVCAVVSIHEPFEDCVTKIEEDWAPMTELQEELRRKVEEIVSCRDGIILRNEWLHRICGTVGVKCDQKAWAVAKVEKEWAKITELKRQLRKAKKKESPGHSSIKELRSRHRNVNRVTTKTQQLKDTVCSLISADTMAMFEHIEQVLLVESKHLMALVEAHPDYTL